MVVVIIAMAFIGILASVLMYMSLLNYQMKVNNLKAKDNFYSAETVLDEIRTAMGERVSASVGSAYELVLKNYEATSAEEKQNKLRYYFLKDMQDYYAVTGSMNINNYDLTKLFTVFGDKEGDGIGDAGSERKSSIPYGSGQHRKREGSEGGG